MMAGRKNDFAIEYCLDANFGGKWLLGRIAYWIDGEMLGDYALGTSLANTLNFFFGLIKYAGRKKTPGFCGIAANKVYEIIDGAIFGDDDTFDRCVDDELLCASPGLLLLTPAIDVFDRCRAYSFECEASDAIIYRTTLDGVTKRIDVSKGSVAATAKIYCDWLDELYRRQALGGGP